MNALTTHPAFGSHTVRYSLRGLSDDADTRVAQTIDVMREYAIADAPALSRDADEALRAGQGDAVRGVFALCKRRFQFQDDMLTAGGVPDLDTLTRESIVETIIRPVDLSLMWQSGLQPVEDCDGYSTYAASLLTHLNVPCAFVTVAVDPRAPDEYSHVYLAVYPNGERVPFDASHGPYVGWEVPNPYGKRREWPLSVQRFDWLVALSAVGAASSILMLLGSRSVPHAPYAARVQRNGRKRK